MSTGKKASLGAALVGTAALTIITASAQSRARRQQQQPPMGPPLPPPPSNYPTTPTVPTEQPRPRAPTKEINFKSLHRYEIVADVLPVDGVGLPTVAQKALAHLRFDGASLRSYKTVQREGVGEVTRVTFQANSLINNSIELDRQISIAGVGSVWLVSAKEIEP